MMAPDTKVLNLAREIGRLSPDWSNPQRYFEERSEIEHKLKRLALEMKEGRHG